MLWIPNPGARRGRSTFGVRTRVVRDTVSERGRIIEDTFDWYAQDDRGTVWYLGEDTKDSAGAVVTPTPWHARYAC